MPKYAYIYKYNSLCDIPFDVKSYDICDVFIGPKYDKYVLQEKQLINNHFIEKFLVIVYKDLNIINIITEKYKYIKQLVQKNNFERINILEKQLLVDILKSKYINNLTKISFDIACLEDEEELLEFKGSKLNEINIFEEFIYDQYNSTIEIKGYSFQPLNYKYLIHVSTNKIEFNSHYVLDEILEITYKYLTSIKGGEIIE